MTTIKDIAEYTGVSATTVSNVIHGKKNRVSPETIEKIQNAIKELNYVPNMFARSLVSNSSKVVALISYVPTRSDADFTDESFQMIFLSTIESILRENGYYLMFRRIESKDEVSHFLQNWNVDALFITGICDQELFDAVSDVNIPTVLLDSYCNPADYCDIGHDDDNGGYMATKYLLDNGHKRIAFASSPMRDGYVMKERLKGYKAALAEAGVPYDSHLVFESDVDLNACRVLAKEMLKVSNLTAVFATTDIMAAGLMTAFRELGKKIPEDISFVGFDDVKLCQMTVPALTTIRQDMAEKAAAAANNMVLMLKGEKTKNKRIELPVELIVRDSVADIRTK